MATARRRIELAPPDIGADEADSLREAVMSRMLSPRGPEVPRFAEELCRRLAVQYVVPVSSGTAALHLALLAAGVGPEDLVITTSFTFVAPGNAIKYCGADPIFLDVDEATLGLSPICLNRFLTTECKTSARGLYHRKTRRRIAAILCIHLYGSVCDMEAIRRLAARVRLPIIEDAAESLGVTRGGKDAGTLGDFGCLSFNANKVITTGGGGAVICHSKKRWESVFHLANVAKTRRATYHHDRVGYNYMMPNLNAAVGRVQLSKLDDITSARRRFFDTYYSPLEKVALYRAPRLTRSNHWMTLLFVRHARQVAACEYFAAAGVEARPAWTPLHLLPPFATAPRTELSVTERLSHAVCLPCHQQLSSQDGALLAELCKDLPNQLRREA